MLLSRLIYTDISLDQTSSSMFSTVIRLTLVLTISIIRFSLAGPDTISTSLPDPLTLILPDCAQSCLSTFIRTQLSSCSDPTSLECLCRARSTTGYTVAEGALACVADTCPFSDVNATTFFVLYNACDVIPDAAPITHATLLATLVTAQPTTTASGLPHSPTFSRRASHTFSHTKSARSSTTHSQARSMPTAVNTTRTSTTSIVTTALALDTDTPPEPPTPTSGISSTVPAFVPIGAASPTAATTAHALNRGQVAGIAVAGVFTAAVAIGLLLVIFCSRRGRKPSEKTDAGSFIERDASTDIERNGPSGDGVLDSLPETPLISRLTAQPRASHGGAKANQFFGLPVAPNQHRQSWWNKFGRSRSSLPPPPPPKPEYIDTRYLAPSMGGISSNASPKSVASYHTTSRLLPDKPLYRPTPEVHEKRCSGETSQDQPVYLAEGVGLRIIAATPEPQGQQPSTGWPLDNSTSQNVMQGHLYAQGAALRPKMSDPFIARHSEHHEPSSGLAPTFRAIRNELPRLDTSTRRNAPSHQGMLASRTTQNQGIPNFRSLINPQPPQLPQSDTFSPITPGFVQGTSQDQENEQYDASQQQKLPSIMDRPRGSSSPFFSSQPSQFAVYKQQPRRDRKKPAVRPETYYTTSSDTEFEEDEESPQEEGRGNNELKQPNNSYPPRARAHASINGLAELPGLSPVAESPISRKTPSSGTTAANTPSPLHSGVSPNLSDDGTKPETPLSKLRYPEIPGQRSSPKREVKHVNLTLGPPVELEGSPTQRNEPQRLPSPGQTRFPRPSAVSQGGEDEVDSDFEQYSQPGRPKLQPSPLRPRSGQGNLREALLTKAMPPVPPLPTAAVDLLSASALKFRDAASRLAASNAGRRVAPESALGNWPVQPVRPVLRPTLIPAPVGAPAYAGSQPSTPITPIDDAAFSPTNAGPYALAAAVTTASAIHDANANEGEYAARSVARGSGSGGISTRVLVSGASTRTVGVLGPQQQRQLSRDAAPQRFQASDRQQQQQQQPYQGPRLSMGPYRHTRGPSRETDRERFMRLELQRLRAREQERRREREFEQAGVFVRDQRGVQAALM